MVRVLAWAPVVPNVKLPALSRDPLVKVMAPTRLAFVLLPMVTGPETVSTGLPVVANVSVAVPLPVPNLKSVHAAFVTLTVTVAPVVIVTVSAEVGTTPPVQVVVAFQFPPVAVLEI